MRFTRVLTADKPDDVGVEDWLRWKTVDAVITASDGRAIFEQRGVEVPEGWSQNAANIIAQKYFRKAGVPFCTSHISGPGDDHIPVWLWRSGKATGSEVGGETSARQVFHRMAGCWAYWGWREGLLTTEDDARVFYDEAFASLALQYAAPNSPQWFNTGIHWAYGIEGPDSGQWYVDDADKHLGHFPVVRIHNSYERPQPHACFIQTVEDDLVNPGGMMDLWTREARLFKHGSGSGSNMSRIRGRGEPLSGGGVSSGLMSFLRVGDRSAGSIKSGGTTRRAALMRVLDVDHPEVEVFIDWKATEEYKAACMAVGSKVINDRLRDVNSVNRRLVPRGHNQGAKDRALRDGVPQSLVDRATAGETDWPVYEANSFEGEAIETVSGQNSNNSVRVPNEFMRSVDANGWHNLTARTDARVARVLRARDLWSKLCHAAWASGDPGVQFSDTINDWHTCSDDGPINASNPCSEYLFLDDTACNLASIRLTKFLPLDDDALSRFEHVVRLWTVVLEISVHMASFPSEAIARNSYLYRTLGLGYADLGGLLMRLAIPYASDEGRALAAGLTALMTGVAYRTSAEMAEEVGPFPRWDANHESFRGVMRRHRRALIDVVERGNTDVPTSAIVLRAQDYWVEVMSSESFRNAQVTLLAPTGTISFVMDCDTTGVEPDFALVKHKQLAGGGSMRIVNQAVPEALGTLGYEDVIIDRILRDIAAGVSPDIDDQDRAVFACANDIAPEDHVRMIAAVQPFLSGGVSKTVNLPNNATVDDVDRAYRLAHRLGVKTISVYRDGSKLSQPLSSGKSGPESLNEFGQEADALLSEVRPEMFDVDWKLSERSNLGPTSGGGPVDMRPCGVEPGPPQANAPEPVIPGRAGGSSASPDQDLPIDTYEADKAFFKRELKVPVMPRGAREYLPWRREAGWTQKIKIGQDRQSVFLRVSEYPDGRPGEVFLEIAGEGSTLRALANCLAISISVGLQRGVPVSEYVDQFVGIKFEPAGYVEGHTRIRFASSIADYIGRELGISYAGRDDLANAPAPIEEAVARVAEAAEQANEDWKTRMGDQIAAYYAETMPSLYGPGANAREWKPTGDMCPGCGAPLRRAGTCRACPNCAWNEGCG